jgi:hypothetical protein
MEPPWREGSGLQRQTLAFSCGARTALKLKAKGYLRSMLSRRQLQGFVRHRLNEKRQFDLLIVIF